MRATTSLLVIYQQRLAPRGGHVLRMLEFGTPAPQLPICSACSSQPRMNLTAPGRAGKCV